MGKPGEYELKLLYSGEIILEPISLTKMKAAFYIFYIFITHNSGINITKKKRVDNVCEDSSIALLYLKYSEYMVIKYSEYTVIKYSEYVVVKYSKFGVIKY